MTKITSAENATFKVLKSLIDKKGRRESGLFFVEGEKVVWEDLDKVTRIFLREGKRVFFPEGAYEVYELSEKLFNQVSALENSSGVLGVFPIPAQGGKEVGKNRVLVLDRIQDPGNMGTLLRTAAAFGFMDVITLDCVDVYGPKVLRAVSGQIFKLNVMDMSFDEFKTWAVGAEFLCALVLGNEGRGVRSEMYTLDHEVVSVPMQNDVESLNVAVAGGILMFEIAGGRMGARGKMLITGV